MTRIIIQCVPADKMRLPAYREDGCGDWFVSHENGDIHIQVAGVDVWDQSDCFAIAVHELFEARACFAHGVTQGAVDAHDIMFEKERADGMHAEDAEPGADRRAPYRTEHAEAMIIEAMVRRFLGIE